MKPISEHANGELFQPVQLPLYSSCLSLGLFWLELIQTNHFGGRIFDESHHETKSILLILTNRIWECDDHIVIYESDLSADLSKILDRSCHWTTRWNCAAWGSLQAEFGDLY